MKVSVIGGAGYVGLITALGSSSMGHDVIATAVSYTHLTLPTICSV